MIGRAVLRYSLPLPTFLTPIIMKIKFIKSHPRYAYFVGDEAVIADTKELIEEGYVIPVKEDKEPPKEAPKAETAQVNPEEVHTRKKRK